MEPLGAGVFGNSEVKKYIVVCLYYVTPPAESVIKHTKISVPSRANKALFISGFAVKCVCTKLIFFNLSFLEMFEFYNCG